MSRSIGGYLNDLLDGKKSKQETVTLLQKQREKFVAKKVKEARVDAIKSYKKVKEARKQTASYYKDHAYCKGDKFPPSDLAIHAHYKRVWR